jgi:hypothetical protein
MPITILDAIHDAKLFGHAFHDTATWQPWLTVLKALFGLDLDDDDLDRFALHTGRSEPNPDGYRESWLICGRRSGKSRILATIAIFVACFKDWRPHLAAGEKAHVFVLARDRAQAKQIFNFALGLLEGSPILATQIVNKTQEAIELRNRVIVEIHASNFRAVRGRTIVCALLDEIAFWMADETSANPDVEVLNAIRPSLATVPGSMLLAASSPYARKGALWKAFDRHYGKDDSAPLVWRAPTRAMNATVPQEFIDEQLAEDEAANRAEYYAVFRSDVERFITLETVRACVGNYVVRHPVSGQKYYAFTDPSGGSSDAWTLAIAHRERDEIHVDAVFGRAPPFSPQAVVAEFAGILREYRIGRVTGDRFAGEFPRELFRRLGIEYWTAKKTRSELYLELLPLLNGGRITIPDDDKTIKQLVSLERNVTRQREQIDHPRGQHDDLCNSLAGAAHLCSDAQIIGEPAFGIYGTRLDIPETRSKFDGLIEDGPLQGGYATSR